MYRFGFRVGAPFFDPRFLPPPSGDAWPELLPHSPRHIVDLHSFALNGYSSSGSGGFFVFTHPRAGTARRTMRAPAARRRAAMTQVR